MGVVERILHEAKAAALPWLVKLIDAPEGRVGVLLDFGQRRERLLRRHPDVAVALGRPVAGDGDAGRIVIVLLRDPRATALAVEGPPVVAALQLPVEDPSLGEARVPVRATIVHRNRVAGPVDP